MAFFQYTIPIKDYYGDKPFFQSYYFTRQISFNEFLKYLDQQHKIALENPEYDFYYENSKESLLGIDAPIGLPRLYGNLISSNKFTVIPKFGQQPITVTKIEPVDLDEECVTKELPDG